MNSLLIVENKELIYNITKYFQSLKINTTIIDDFSDTSDFVQKDNFYFFVIDSLIGSTNVEYILQEIRSYDKLTPILIINCFAKPGYIDNVYDYNIYDCLRQPFIFNEFKIKFEKCFHINKSKVIIFSEELYYNENNKTFYYNKEPILLTNKESKFCELLIDNLNNLVYYHLIYDYVWEGENKDIYFARYLVSNIRKKIPLNIIKTVSKLGYKIIKSSNE